MRAFRFAVAAQAFQFHLRDESLGAGPAEEAVAMLDGARLALAPGIVGIGTARPGAVTVLVELHEDAPPTDVEAWGQVAEVSLDLPSGRLLVAGVTDPADPGGAIDTAPGCYRLRIACGMADERPEQTVGDEEPYRIQLWPAPDAPPMILKLAAE